MKRPSAQDSERALAAAVALAQDISTVVDLEADDFENPRCGAVWRAGTNAVVAGDYGGEGHTAALMRHGDLSLDGLVRLMDEHRIVGGVKWHAGEVRKAAALRRHQQALVDMAEACGLGAEPEEIASQVTERFALQGHGRSALRSARDIIEATILDIKARANGTVQVIESGYRALDERIGGFELGGSYVIGARPKMGKSAFAMSVAIGAAKRSVTPSLFFSHEMTVLQLGRRLIAHEGGVPISSLKRPRHALHMDAIGRGSKRAASLPISFCVGRAKVSEISSIARRWRRSIGKGKAMLVVDYLQLIDRVSTRSTNDAVAEVSRELKLLAVELDVALILLSQLNRSLESRDNKRPRASDLRDSGAIEQDADAVVFLYRPWVYDSQKPPHLCEAIVAAAREAEPGTVNLRFEPEYTRFANQETT